jgi:hypothetical protein
VSQSDPEKAILEAMAGPVGQARFGASGAGAVRAGIIEGGNWCEPDLTTVRFVKYRETSTRRLYFVTFRGSIPHLGTELLGLSELYLVTLGPDGNWTAAGGAGGGDDEHMSRGTPWVNFAGEGWRHFDDELVRALPGQFYAGGRVHDAGVNVARVQLRFADSVVLEDDTDAGVVLFVTDHQVQLPATAILLAPTGARVGSQTFPAV